MSGNSQLLTVGTGGADATWASPNALGQTPELDFDNDGVSNGDEFVTANANGSETIIPAVPQSPDPKKFARLVVTVH